MQYTEAYPEVNAALSVKISRSLFSGHSRFQKIEVMETAKFGRILLLDELVMLTERDEFIYHEMITHVPLLVHPNPKRVLVIGGGDGGTVRECLKHHSVEHIDLVDIDEMVTQVCLKHFPKLANAVFDERVECHFVDGVQFVKNAGEKYDIIIIDSTDPIAVGEGLFTRPFYQSCFELLNPDGILTNQSESPAWLPNLVSGIARKLNSVFPIVQFYQANIPTYPSGHWLFGFASKKYHPVNDLDSIRSIRGRYYDADIHRGAFNLPVYVKELVDHVE